MKLKTLAGSLLITVAYLAGGGGIAHAATPVAVWNGDFAAGSEGKRGIFTIDLNNAAGDGTVNSIENGIIKIGNLNGGVRFDHEMSGKIGDYTFIVGVKGLASSTETQALMTQRTDEYDKDSNRTRKDDLIGIVVKEGGTVDGIWDGSVWAGNANTVRGTYPTDASALHKIAWRSINTTGADGSKVYADGDTSAVLYSASEIVPRDRYRICLTLGGKYGDAAMNASGLEISYLAILNSVAMDDIALWSLPTMTETKDTFTGATEKTGVNFAGTESLSAATEVAAVFVQSGDAADNKITVTKDATLTAKAVYVAEGAGLTVALGGLTGDGLAALATENGGTYTLKLVDAPVFGNVTLELPTAPAGYKFLTDGATVTVVSAVDYDASVTGEAQWAAEGMVNVTPTTEGLTWVNNEESTITLSNEEDATLTFKEDVTAQSLTLNGPGTITLKKDDGVTVAIGDTSTVTKSIIAKTDAVLEGLGSAAAVRICDAKKVTLKDYAALPAGSSMPDANGTLRLESSTTALTALPWPDNNLAGYIEIAQPIELAGGSFRLRGNRLGYTFDEGTTMTLSSQFVLGDSDGAAQTVTQKGGTITVTGNGSEETTGAAVLLGHWSNANVTLNTEGGAFTANSAVARLGWDAASTTWNIGGGEGTATVNALGVKAGGNTTALNLKEKGTLNLTGIYGLKPQSRTTVTFAGGTLKVTPDESASVWSVPVASGGTVRLAAGTASTIEVADNANASLSVSAVIADPSLGEDETAGTLKKTGVGTLTLSAANTATGTLTVEAGTLTLNGGTWAGSIVVKSGAKLNVVSSSASTALVTGESSTVTLEDGATLLVNGAENASGYELSEDGKSLLYSNTRTEPTTLYWMPTSADSTLTDATSLNTQLIEMGGVYYAAGSTDTLIAGDTVVLWRGTQTASITVTLNNTLKLADIVVPVGSVTFANDIAGHTTKVTGGGTVAYTPYDTTTEQYGTEATYAPSSADTVIRMNVAPGAGSSFAMADDWTGTFQIGWQNTGALLINTYGNANSTVEFVTAMTAGYFKSTNSNDHPAVAPTVKLSANVTITDGYTVNLSDGVVWADATTTRFSTLTGSGTLSTMTSGYDKRSYYSIAVLTNFTGKLQVNNKSALKIGTVVLDAVPTLGETRIVQATVGTSNALIDNLANTTVVVDGATVATGLAVGEDGLYLAAAAIGTDTYLTVDAAVEAAGDDTTITTITLLNGATVATAPDGWEIGDGVLTRIVTGGLDPTSGTLEATVEYSGTEEGEALTNAVIAAATVTAPNGVDATTYKGYFTYAVTDNGEGSYTVTLTGIAEPVTTTACTTALSVLTGDAESGTVTIPAGLYYAITPLTALDDTTATTVYGLSTGEAITVTKPNGDGKGFIKIEMGPQTLGPVTP